MSMRFLVQNEGRDVCWFKVLIVQRPYSLYSLVTQSASSQHTYSPHYRGLEPRFSSAFVLLSTPRRICIFDAFGPALALISQGF